MASTFLNQMRMIFRATTGNRDLLLANNYNYVNEENISRSLICPVCLDPLLEPQTHVLCDNSFCTRCISKLKYCPCCRAPIINGKDLKLTTHILRNILDELEIQCNVCKKRLYRGHFSVHIQSNCLEYSNVTIEEEENLIQSTILNQILLDEKQTEKHLSNLYRRVYTLEKELFELKKSIYICLLVLLTLVTLLFFGSILFYTIYSFLFLVFKQWLPSSIEILIKFLFDYSPLTTLTRISFVGLYFILVCYKRYPSDINLLTIIICIIIVFVNFLILLLHLIINHFNFLFLILITILIGKHLHIKLRNNQQILIFINDFYNQQQI